MRFEDEKNFLPLRIHFYSIPFARLIDNLLSRIRRKNKLIVLKYKYRYILLFKKLIMNVFIASQTNRRKFVYVRHPLKLLRIRTKLGPKLYIDPPRRCSSRDHGRRGHGRRETFVSTNYKLLNWSDWSGPPVIRSTCRRSVSCRMRKGEKLEKNLATSRPEPVSPSSRPICLSVEHLLFFPLLLPPPPPFSSTLNLISLGWAANFSISGSVGTLFGSMLLPPRFD